MKPQDDASHYVPAHKVPQIDATSSVARFFAVLQDARAGGALVLLPDSKSRYVSGRALGTAVLARAKTDGTDAASELSIHTYLRALEQEVPVTATNLHQQSEISALALGENAPYEVHRVLEDGCVTGLLFTHESLRDSVLTNPPVWICADGDENDQYDSGYCSYCPEPLDRMKTP